MKSWLVKYPSKGGRISASSSLQHDRACSKFRKAELREELGKEDAVGRPRHVMAFRLSSAARLQTENSCGCR